MARILVFQPREDAEKERILAFIKECLARDDYFAFVSHRHPDGVDGPGFNMATNINSTRYHVYLRGLLHSGISALDNLHPVILDEVQKEL